MKGTELMDRQYTYEDFLEIIKTLRSESGCPWDKEQTHESLKPCMMEEAAEVVSAIRIYDRTGSAENLREELGDVLLQVVMHAQIAEEEGLFTMAEVVHDVAAKMVRRHPHVFGDAQAETAGEVLQNWEEIKKQEKEGKEWIHSPLTEIPWELPALTRAPKVLKKAGKFYGYSSTYEEDLEKLSRAVEELKSIQPQAYDERLKEKTGDILLTLSDISRLYKLSQEQILTDRIEDIIDQYERNLAK